MDETVLAIGSLAFLVVLFVGSVLMLFKVRQPKAVKLEGNRAVLTPEEQRILQIRLAKQAERLQREKEEEKRKAAIATAKPSLYQEKLRLREEERAAQEAIELAEKQRENDEYKAWKTRMSVTEGGEGEKCSSVEEIVAHFSGKWADLTHASEKFRMPVSQLVERIDDLEKLGLIYGVVDDRGRYLSISRNERESIKKYIQGLTLRKSMDDFVSDINAILSSSDLLENSTNI